MAGLEDLIDIFRGESVPLNPFKGRSSSLYNTFGKSRMGKYATTSAAEAANYATKKFPNVIKSTKITPTELKIGKRIYHELKPDFTSEGVKLKKVSKSIQEGGERALNRNYNILSKKNKAKLKVDILKTFMSNAKALSPLAIKGLNVLASLPVATLTMILTPTKMGNAEATLEDFAKLHEGSTNVDKALPSEPKDI